MTSKQKQTNKMKKILNRNMINKNRSSVIRFTLRH